ncbi:PGC-1 and ERR-induced regulator in muscle protein 1 [Etheostoma cragini]|uniref:PGC-1 and ERR-induced regulator in muscle protein 1 n=1 Tax=Etheostoma cragini TaxID=417921 RepID=UPI00155E7B92|nr:PGC-1 and ERR-induced regulator in muscle protein 1 [Etheostoma cragini]
MEDFEFSVEICDRDWECFFAECEECDLLPPSLAVVDDSGMSDIDDTRSIHAKMVKKANLTAGLSEADHPIDGPPDCEGSPVECYLSKHVIGGMESVLSGSEEEIHLQSVNIFFETLKERTEAEKLTEPNQVRNGKNREALLELEWCSDGQQASISSLPKNIPKLTSLPASYETAVGKETAEPVNTIRNKNTMKKNVPGSNISPEPAASNLMLQTNKSAYPETRFFIREEACTETRVIETTLLNQSQDSLEGDVSSEKKTHTDKVKKVEMSTPLDYVKQYKPFSTDSLTNLAMLKHVQRKEDQNPNLLQSATTCTNVTTSNELSPNAIKRKRRKKRRLSFEPAESVQERRVLVKQSDSDEEQYALRGGTGLCFFEDINLSYLNKQQQKCMSSLTTYSATSNLPVKISAKEILSHYSPPSDSQYKYLPETIVRSGRCKATGWAENNATNDMSVTSMSQTDNSVMSATSNSGIVATNVQPCSKLHVEESTGLPVSITGAQSDLATETANCERKGTHTGSLQQSEKINHSLNSKNYQNPESFTEAVRSISILPSADSYDPAMEVSQNDQLSAAKLVLAVEAGNCGRDNHTLCQREAEPQQQLEIDRQVRDQYRSPLEKTHFPLSASSSDTRNSKPKQVKTPTSPFMEISSQVGCAKLTSHTSNALPDNHCLVKNLSSLDLNITAQQTEHPLVLHTLSKFDVLSMKNTTDERTELAASQTMAFQSGNSLLSGEINPTGEIQKETKLPMSEDLLTSPSYITQVSSCCTLDTESALSLLDMSGSSCLSVNQNDSINQAEETSLMLAKHDERDGTSEFKSQPMSNDTTDSKCDLVLKAEDVITASKEECKPEKAPDSKCSVFAMSSFWSEMEKLTINDILGLQIISKAAPPNLLPPLQESEETNMFAMTDSGVFQLDESKSEQTNEDTSSNPNYVESSSGSVMAVDSSCSRGAMWRSLGADIYPETMMLTSVRDISQPVLPGGAQTCLRKISKNVSVHNLHALESFRYTREGHTLKTLDQAQIEKEEYFTDGHIPANDKDVDSLASFSTDSYRISLTDIYQYLFGGTESIPSQSERDKITTCYTDGNSVPETYDHFFSEFDTEGFFYPFIKADDPTKNEQVPIFSCSRSANRNLQFPEAYDHFFASSSSDDSSVESDEEDSCSPVRVVTRFSRASSASQSSTDIYENFCTDGDLRLFWKTTLSFRNISLTGSTVQKRTLQNPLSHGPVRRSGTSLVREVHPINALGNQDLMVPDPLLYHMEDRSYTQIARRPFRYEDLETTVSNPRLDASLLPLRQSDMCLVCIAFASWVLKTANPQVGDTWKAVLLANVSALSAIRYLRKYVKMEAAASEKKFTCTNPSDSSDLSPLRDLSNV